MQMAWQMEGSGPRTWIAKHKATCQVPQIAKKRLYELANNFFHFTLMNNRNP